MRLDLIIRAGSILTMDEARPSAREMGVIGGRIVGFDEELAGCTADRIEDFGDATITPGFIDAHCHTTWWGLGLAALDLSPARGLEELYALLESEMLRLADQPGVWLNGTGFNHKHHDGLFPDINRLDAITGDRPLYLRHVSGHASITNTATLALAGAFAGDFTNPVGGAVVRDADGNVTGLVEESAQGLIQNLLLPYSVEQIIGALDAATTRYAAEGITSFTEAGIGGGWIGHSPVEITAYQQALDTGRLHARAQLMPALDALEEQTSHAADAHGTGGGRGLGLGIRAGFGNEHLSLGPVKVFMDGSLLGATAAVTEDYCGHQHNTGYLLDTPAQYLERVSSAYRSGWPVALHAIGDAAIDLAIEIISGLQEKHGPNALPNRIEHFGIARPDQVAAVARHGIAVTPQASFIGPLGDQFAQLSGPNARAGSTAAPRSWRPACWLPAAPTCRWQTTTSAARWPRPWTAAPKRDACWAGRPNASPRWRPCACTRSMRRGPPASSATAGPCPAASSPTSWCSPNPRWTPKTSLPCTSSAPSSAESRATASLTADAPATV